MMKKTIFALALSACVALGASAQRLGVWAVGFYNLENLFDTEDDPNNKGDNDFLPTGSYQWTQDKYEQKLHNIATVFSKLAREHCPAGPAVIGIAEVENERVVRELCERPEVASMGLKYIHFEGPDRRGIDVGLIYNPRLFKVLSTQTYRLQIPDRPDYATRDQLLVSGTLGGEPVSIIVNHWPSRYGGSKSAPLRAAAAALSKHIADSVQAANPANKVIIMGDLNDDPKDASCAEVIGAARKKKDAQLGGYYNTMWPIYDKGVGSLCYQDVWCLYDQQIISTNFVRNAEGFLPLQTPQELTFWKAEVFNRDFITTPSGKKKGYPLRSFNGNVWQNGYADHFPTITYYVKQIP